MQSPVSSMDFDFSLYSKYFVTTVLIEAPVYFFALRFLAFKTKLKLVLSVNLATHPIVFYLFPWVLMHWHLNYGAYVLSAEIFAPLVEGLMIWKIFKVPASAAFAAAFAANIISWWLGILIL